MKLLSLFSGVGAFERALQNIGVDFELTNYCEFDPYASKSYALIHNVSENKNLGDISKVNVRELKPVDLITYGFPCQDISLAGNSITVNVLEYIFKSLLKNEIREEEKQLSVFDLM